MSISLQIHLGNNQTSCLEYFSGIVVKALVKNSSIINNSFQIFRLIFFCKKKYRRDIVKITSAVVFVVVPFSLFSLSPLHMLMKLSFELAFKICYFE